MRSMIAALLALTFLGAGAAAEDQSCLVGAYLVSTDFALPQVAAAIDKTRSLDIVVIGTGSSILAGPGGADIAYPARLKDALASRLPGVTVRVVSHAKMRQTAGEMAEEFGKLLAAKPTLVVWQTGTFDAMKGVDLDEFRTTLDEGVGVLKAGGADVVLMNMQYSPRTESVIAVGGYADNMQLVAQQREVPLFDRMAVMKHWSEMGTFDFHEATRDLDTAARVHGCIAQLLADLIVEGAKASRTQPRAIQ